MNSTNNSNPSLFLQVKNLKNHVPRIEKLGGLGNKLSVRIFIRHATNINTADFLFCFQLMILLQILVLCSRARLCLIISFFLSADGDGRARIRP
jgi:hypothetical protein